jgi:hypothetical protein
LRDNAQRTYLDIGSLIPPCQTNDVHNFLQSAGLPKRNRLGSMTQGGSGMMEERGRCWSMVRRLDEGHALEWGYLGYR